jgi:hypothetical protein
MKDRLLNIALVLSLVIAIIGANKGLRNYFSGAVQRSKNAIIALQDSNGGRNSQRIGISNARPVQGCPQPCCA